MNNYLYNADIGTFEIIKTGHERFRLWLGEELLGEYASAEEAAADVASFDTGYPEWDQLENEIENVPATLDDWTPVAEETPEV